MRRTLPAGYQGSRNYLNALAAILVGRWVRKRHSSFLYVGWVCFCMRILCTMLLRNINQIKTMLHDVTCKMFVRVTKSTKNNVTR